jgi:tetratricopeptide (TPR) repeat protein
VTKALEIHQLAETGQIQLYLKNDDDCRIAPPVTFQDPLDASDRQEIEWYFQGYLDNPFGAAKARAEAVETGLRNLGRLLFELVFRGNQDAQSLYASAAANGLGEYQLVIRSQYPDFLALPWELMNEPQTGYVAPQLAAVVRQASGSPMPPFTSPLPTNQFNVLLVSPLPDPDSGTSSGSLAIETVKVLESLNVQVELDYLRPPTFTALAERLAQRPGQYHLAHIDGLSLGKNPGEIFLENAACGPDPVPTSQFAELLTTASVPVALLTPSSRTSDALKGWAGVATKLVQGGVPLVVTLPYPLHGSATAEQFIRQFYQPLTEGRDVASCIAQARKALMDDPQRMTLTGKQVFWDWITPLVYQSREYLPQAIAVEQPDPLAPPTIQTQQPLAEAEAQLPAAGPFGLVGRRAELRQLERLFHQEPIVLLAGNTGVGKTELALGLARWFQQTGRSERSGGVFYTTFEASHPTGLERVIHEIGTAIAGLEFADMSATQQRQWVMQYLQERPSLLIWDNLEYVAGFPTGATGLLEPAELAELNDFLSQVTQPEQSWALLVSRRQEEPWLSAPHLIEGLLGLPAHDRIELAENILEKAGVGPSRAGPECLELLDLIEGHPLAMQIALPLLKDVPASVLLAEVSQGIEALPPAAQEEGRDPYLTAIMEYSWGKMSHRSRTHLPFLALFQRRVMQDILNHITQERIYRTVMGEELGWGACRTLLRSALAAGFLEPVSPSVYQIHPAVPWFLGRKLAQQVPASGIRQLEQEFVRVYADTADYFMESLYENQDSGATAVLAEEGNLVQALGLALEAGQWDNAQLLVQPLAQVYRMQKRFPELRRLRRQLLDATGHTSAEAQSKGSIELWLYLLGTEANEAVDLRDLEHAEELNRQLLEYLTSQPGGESDPRTAAVYHQLGLVAMHRWQLDAAAGLLQQSLAIIEHGDDRAAVADDYYALGQVKQYQRYYTEAKEWYQKALDIHQRLPDEEEMVKDYRALGLISQLKFEYQESESWYHRARDLVEEHRDEETAILIYHELGTVCHAQYLFDQAISWYQQALHLSDRLGKEEQMAVEFHHLGLLAQTRGIVYDEAEEWYLAALEKWEKLSNRRAIGDECRQLGVLFHEQKRYGEAEQWYLQAREVFEGLGDVQRAARTYGQLGMVAEEQGNLTGALEWVARTYQLAVDHHLPVLVQVKAHMARLRDKYGPDNFITWWQNFNGEAPPADLEVDTSAML